MLWYGSGFPFFRLYSIGWIYHLFIHSCTCGYKGCFHPLAIVNNAAGDMVIEIPVWVPAFSSLGSIPRKGIAGSCGNSAFNFLRTHQIPSHSSCTTYTPTSSAQRLPFLHSLTNTCYFRVSVTVILMVWSTRFHIENFFIPEEKNC